MESLVLMTAATLVAALFVYSLARVWRNLAHADAPPLLSMLAACGSSADQTQETLGPEAMALALRRCTFCASGESCRQKAAAGKPRPDYCPNAGFIAHAVDLQPR
jgi:hypothetical protein